MPRSVASPVFFTRSGSIAREISRKLEASFRSIDAALYRFNQPALARTLEDASRRGVSVRIVIDRQKYEGDQTTRQLLRDHALPFRLSGGLRGAGSKMHHKFAVLDGETALTGSYNWTRESEEENYDNLLIVSDAAVVAAYREEFELLWERAEPMYPVQAQG